MKIGIVGKSRYIDADALLESVKSKRLIFEESTPIEEAIAEQVSVFEEAIEEAPTADVVEVRHGAWMSAYEYALKIGCTDERRLEEAKADKRWKFCPFCEQQVKWDFNYCPECGAKMDGERSENGK